MRNPSRLQRVESSAVFVKSPYTTEIRLSEALGTKYNACMNTDALLASCSYQPSPCKSSAPVRTRTPEETRKFRSGLAILMAGYGLNSMILACRALERYVDGDEFFMVEASCFVSSLSSFLAFLFAHTANVKNLFRRNDALRATVYFNTDDENWVKSLVAKTFNSSERGSFDQMGCYCALPRIGINLVFILLLSGMYCDIRQMRTSQQDYLQDDKTSVSTLEVQLAQSVRDKDAERADVLKFDVAKVVQLFANDMSANDIVNSRKSYCHFIITEPEGAIVYGRLRAKGISEHV
ncbi:hypothetical protein V1505DRAFT_402818 [Lipomyces doorenjongii]